MQVNTDVSFRFHTPPPKPGGVDSLGGVATLLFKVPRGPYTGAPATGLTNLLNEVAPHGMHAACDLSTPEALFRSLTHAELIIHTISSLDATTVPNRAGPKFQPFREAHFDESDFGIGTKRNKLGVWNVCKLLILCWQGRNRTADASLFRSVLSALAAALRRLACSELLRSRAPR